MLVENEIKTRENPLLLRAKELEKTTEQKEITNWDQAFIGDGLKDV